MGLQYVMVLFRETGMVRRVDGTIFPSTHVSHVILNTHMPCTFAGVVAAIISVLPVLWQPEVLFWVIEDGAWQIWH